MTQNIASILQSIKAAYPDKHTIYLHTGKIIVTDWKLCPESFDVAGYQLIENIEEPVENGAIVATAAGIIFEV